MRVDVRTDVVIARPREVVAAYAADPDRAPAWYQNITSVEWKTPLPLAVGSRIAFVAQFLGRPLAYTYEVVEWRPNERFVMRTADGPMSTPRRPPPRSSGTPMMCTLRIKAPPRAQPLRR